MAINVSLTDFFNEEELIVLKKFILQTNWGHFLNYYVWEDKTELASFNALINRQKLDFLVQCESTMKNHKRYTSLKIANGKFTIFILSSIVSMQLYQNFIAKFDEIKVLLLNEFFTEISEALRVYLETNLNTISSKIVNGVTIKNLKELLKDIDVADLLNRVWNHIVQNNNAYEDFVLQFDSSKHYLEGKIRLKDNPTTVYFTIDEN